jgi:CubicO group peptidase (beta-lactamase class C family)
MEATGVRALATVDAGRAAPCRDCETRALIQVRTLPSPVALQTLGVAWVSYRGDSGESEMRDEHRGPWGPRPESAMRPLLCGLILAVPPVGGGTHGAVAGEVGPPAAHLRSRTRAAAADYAPLGHQLDSVRSLLHIPGLAAAITVGNRIAWVTGLGAADLERHRPVTARTHFPIASITKTMAAVVLMQLVHEGKLSLDAPVDSLIPGAALPPDVRAAHLLSHTSELGPGDEYLYSGARFNLLGHVVERVGAQPLADALETRIFDPVGMARTVAPAGPLDPRTLDVATPYDFDATAATHFRPGTPAVTAIQAATGVVSTAEDLARYAIALDQGRLLDAASTLTMTTPRRSTNGAVLPYAMGWFSQEYLGEPIRWHYGQEVSYASLLLWLPRRHMSLVVLANSATMSDAARLLDGNVAYSLVAQVFFRTVARLSRPRELERDDRIATALAAVYLGELDRADSVTRRAFADAPALAHAPDLGLLFLLTRLDDRTLDGAAMSVADTLVHAHPTLPPALYYASLAATQAGDTARAAALLERLAALPHPPRHYSVALGLRDLGILLAPRHPADARAALQRVIDMNLDVDGAVDTAKRVLRSLSPG